MARVVALLSLLVGVVRGLENSEEPTQLQRSCQYAGRVYVEGDDVRTDQPCLKCTCSRGSLVCYRRMCPSPSPSEAPGGCALLPSTPDSCCPSLVCDDGAIHRGGTTESGGQYLSSSEIFTTDQILKHASDEEVESTLAGPPGDDIHAQKTQDPSEGRSRHGAAGPVARSAPVAESVDAENATAGEADGGGTTEAGTTTAATGTTAEATSTTAVPTTTMVTETATTPAAEPPPTTTTEAASTTASPESTGTSAAAAAATTTTTTTTTTEATSTTASPESTGTSAAAAAATTTTTTTTTTEATSTAAAVVATPTTTTAAGALRREDADVDKPAETTFVTSLPTTVIIPEDMFVTDITLRKNVSIAGKDGNATSYLAVRTVPPHIEALINISHNNKDDDYDTYDYGAPPSLPPSLPNVKIIPFVAADAVLENGEDKVTAYPMQDKHLPTDNPLYSRFSPPIKTEGGFQPREPILDGPFYESKLDGPFDTTGHLSLDITSGTLIPPSITILPKSEEKVCYSDGREYGHGELLSDPGACLVCVCHRGEVFCQDTKCPPLTKGCTRVKEKRTTCCGRIVCDGDEFPTVVLAGVVPPITVADGVVTTLDPFRDVIRTEPAPDLPSLIGDLKPYLFDRHTTTGHLPVPPTSAPRRPTAPTTETHVETEVPDKPANLTQPSSEGGHGPSSLFDTVYQFLFAGDTTLAPAPRPTAREPPNNDSFAVQTNAISEQGTGGRRPPEDEAPTTEVQRPEADSISTNSLVEQNETVRPTSTVDPLPGRPPNTEFPEQPDLGAASGILKLAGCNIYGRMYRVGRIISELSTPCLECMCTEVGVQCKQLKC